MRDYTFTASIIIALFLWSCTEVSQNDGSSNLSLDTTSASTTPTHQDTRNIQSTTLPQAISFPDTAWRSERLKDLDPRDITQAEIDELIALEKQQEESRQAFQRQQQAWAYQDSKTRGPQPEWKELVKTDRLEELQGKVQIASIRKTYGNIDTKILSKADAEEYIALQQAQTRLNQEYRKLMSAWSKQDPLTRGPRPEGESVLYGAGNNPRLEELQAKVQTSYGVKQEIDRIEILSKTHNLPILDSEMSELIQLHSEEKRLQGEIQDAVLNAITSASGEIDASALSGGQVSGGVIEKLPKDLLLRMSEVTARLEAIEAPFIAADKADKVRENMSKLSETSGVPISYDDIEETVVLNAEKDKILKKIQLEAGRKWISEGGPVTDVQTPLPNAEDDARLKVIEARLKAISAPMIEAK